MLRLKSKVMRRCQVRTQDVSDVLAPYTIKPSSSNSTLELTFNSTNFQRWATLSPLTMTSTKVTPLLVITRVRETKKSGQRRPEVYALDKCQRYIDSGGNA